MFIRRLRVQHCRNHQDKSFKFTSRVTVFVGKNGSGKTTLLEALYIALRGTSFRGSDMEFLQDTTSWWRIDVEAADKRIIKFDSEKTSGRKKIEIDEKVSYRLPAQKKHPVVLFEPDDLRLLSGSPSRRRKFIDTFISVTSPSYVTVLRRYERAIKQRNALLKQKDITSDDVFVWDVAIGEYGSEIIKKRIEVIERINKHFNETYASIAGTNDTVSVHYSHTLIGSIQQRLMNELRGSFERDKLLGATSVGPHRHDILFEFNGRPAMTVASRGEVRSIILALKFIEVDVAEEITGEAPIILLDDVFAELDETRQERLAEKCRDNQMFITSTAAYKNIEAAEVISLD